MKTLVWNQTILIAEGCRPCIGGTGLVPVIVILLRSRAKPTCQKKINKFQASSLHYLILHYSSVTHFTQRQIIDFTFSKLPNHPEMCKLIHTWQGYTQRNKKVHMAYHVVQTTALHFSKGFCPRHTVVLS